MNAKGCYVSLTSEVYRTEYRDLADARASIGVFLEKVYNRKRLHSALGYLPPAEFERGLLSQTNKPGFPIRNDSAVEDIHRLC